MDLIPPVSEAGIAIEVRPNAAQVAVVKLTGSLSSRDPGTLLAPLFDKLHAFLLADKRKVVRVDMRELKFMNSSSFKHFVSWVKANGGLPPDRRYQIIFMLSPTHQWQKVSMHALSCFSADEIKLEQA